MDNETEKKELKKMVSTDVGIWIAAILTIFMTTLAWKDQPLSQIAEYLMVGVVTANSIVMAFENVNKVAFTNIIRGSFIYLIPVLLGIAAYTRYSKQYYWFYRYPIALVVGIGVGTSMRGDIGASVINQITDSFFRLTIQETLLDTFNNIFLFVTVISCLMYFVFTIKLSRSPTYLKITQFGRYAMMGAFGYSFANTFATRIYAYVGRIQFIVIQWLQLAA